MTHEISQIKNSKHPYLDALNTTIKNINTIFNSIIIILNCVGFLTSIVALVRMIEKAERHSDVDVNIFGYIMDLDYDTFGGSAFVVFLYISTIFAVITLAIFAIKTITIAILKTKANTLNSIYRNECLTEFLVERYVSQKNEVYTNSTNE